MPTRSDILTTTFFLSLCRRLRMMRLLLLAAMLYLPSLLHAQIDSVFWFAAPDLFQSHGDRPMLLRIASFDQPAEVTISQPANPAFPVITRRVGARSALSVDLTQWADLVENAPANRVNKKGLLVRSTALISVYYDIANNLNGDMFSLKGKNALGTAFHVPFQSAFSNKYPISTIEIVATQDNTSVTINPSKDMAGHKAGVPFVVALNRGETFSCAAASLAGADHLAGTFITADRPIALTTRDESFNPGTGGCLDTAGDQLIPDKKAGEDFIILKGFLDAPDNVYVLAIQDGTVVNIDGNQVAVLKEGESYRLVLNQPTAYIRTSKPTHVFQISGFGCEVGGAVIPTLTCTGSRAVSITRATTQFLSVNIIAPTEIIGSFTFNGLTDVITAAKFQPVPGTGGAYSYARMELSTATMPVGMAAYISNARGKFQLGFIHGDRNSTCRYAYFSAFAEGDLELAYTPGPYCAGSSVLMTARSAAANRFSWQGPNGFRASGSQLLLDSLQPMMSGYYVVSTVGAECNEKKDSVYIDVKGKTVIKGNLALCAGTQHTLPSGRIINSGGLYYDTLRYRSGCDSVVRIIDVYSKPLPRITVASSNNVNCEVGAAKLTVTGARSYAWAPAATLSNAHSSTPVARPQVTTLYTVVATGSNGCTTTDSIAVQVTRDYSGQGHGVPSAFTPNGDGRNDCFGVPHWGWVNDFSMQVYNRWGLLVFQTTDINQCWDGAYKGKAQASEVFIYVITAQTGCGTIKRQGSVVLIR